MGEIAVFPGDLRGRLGIGSGVGGKRLWILCKENLPGWSIPLCGAQAVCFWIRVRELELHGLLMRIADARLVQGMATEGTLKQVDEAGTASY